MTKVAEVPVRLVYDLTRWGVGEASDAQLRQLLTHAMRFLVAQNVAYLCAHPDTPLLMNAGVRYRPPPPPQASEQCPPVFDLWQDIPAILAQGPPGQRFADCEKLVGWRVAELLVRGEPARSTFDIQPVRAGVQYIHVLVERPGGVIEDPSADLGMPVPGRRAMGA